MKKKQNPWFDINTVGHYFLAIFVMSIGLQTGADIWVARAVTIGLQLFIEAVQWSHGADDNYAEYGGEKNFWKNSVGDTAVVLLACLQFNY